VCVCMCTCTPAFAHSLSPPPASALLHYTYTIHCNRGSGKYDEYADYAVFKHLHPPPSHEAGVGPSRQGTLYTAVLLLSDRSFYTGGNVLVLRHKGRKRLRKRRSRVQLRANTGGEGGEGEEDDSKDDEDGDEGDEGKEEEEEEEEWEEEEILENPESFNVPGGKRKFFAKYDPTSSQVSRFTPEKGELLLLHGDFSHGMLPLLYGEMKALVVEFWAHADAEVGDKRPALSEAKPLLPLQASPHSDL
jgi:hypothetical protein